MSPRLFVLRFLRRWHARIGLTAALFFLVLALTGLALNHGSDLALDAKYVHVSWLARWYGIKDEPPHRLFRSAHHGLVAAHGRWLLDGRAFGEKLPQPVGLVELHDMVVIAGEASLYVYRSDGKLIDRLERDALPGVPIDAVGSSGRELVLKTAAGTFVSTDALSWQPAPGREIAWSVPNELSASERQAYEKALAPGISVQQLLVDLHSGRFAGRHGPLIVDLLALMLVVLALSGTWLFLVPRRRRERH
jgi:hypothetical protein